MDKIETIRTFVTVAHEKSFRKAASRLNLSPAIVSKYVNALEDRLGVRLINRTTRSMSLSEDGRIYLQRAIQLLEDFDELDHSVQQSAARLKGKIRISAPRTLGEAMLMDTIVDFIKEYPEVDIDVDLNDRFVDIVEEGFDLAIRVGNLEDSSLFVRKFLNVPVVPCCSARFLETIEEPKVPQDLKALSCILDGNRRIAHKWDFIDQGKEVTVEVAGRLKVNSALAVREAILQDAGIGYTPYFAVAKEVESGAIKLLLKDFQFPALPVHAVYPHSRHLSAKVRLFVDFLVKRYKNQTYGL